MKPSSLPALSQSRNLRFATVSVLYVAQGMPYGLFMFAIPPWLLQQGASTAEVAAFQAVSFLPWGLKFLAAPFMDRIAFPAMGRRRPWILFAQIGLVLSLIALAGAPTDLASLRMLGWMAFGVSLFAATQDVAVDGMSIDILPEGERGRANAFMFGAQVLGISGGTAGGAWALSEFGLWAAALGLAACATAIMLLPLCLRERPGERLLPWTRGTASPAALAAARTDTWSMLRDLMRGLLMPMSLLLFALQFLGRMGGGVYLPAINTLTVQELGWDATTYANWSAVGQIAGAVGGVIGGWLIDRYGVRRVVGSLLAVRLAMFLVVGLAVSVLQIYPVAAGLIVAEYAVSQAITTSVIAVFMNLCLPRVAATQFSLYMASANLAVSAGGSLTAKLAPIASTQELFLVVAALNAVFLLLWPLFSLEKHRARLGREAAEPIPAPQETVAVV